MGKTTIEWCDYTFNPWWGCSKVSEGCEHCYAEAFDRRVGGKHWGRGMPRREFGDDHWAQPLKWNRRAEKEGTRPRVFCASMADVFDEEAPAGARSRLWRLIEATPRLDWLLLTKRPKNIAALMPWSRPWPNVWLGCTAENQQRWDERVPILLKLPAPVRFVSVEPMLGPVRTHSCGLACRPDWIICGAESGHGARPMSPSWVRDLRDDCKIIGAQFFFKQDFMNRRKVSLPLLDGKQWTEIPR